MTLEEIRTRIDAIDGQIKELFLARMEVAKDVATVKNDAHETNIFRADREQSMIERLTADVPPEVKAEYAAFIRKTTEVSRMYQYGLLCEWNPEYMDALVEGVEVQDTDTRVKIHIARNDAVNAMSAMLCMIGDYGYQMDQMTLLKENKEEGTVLFELVIRGNLKDKSLQKLLFQLSRETLGFRIIASF